MSFKNYLQRLLEAQTVYGGTRFASPSVRQVKDGNENLGTFGEGTFWGDVFDNMREMQMNPEAYEIQKREIQRDGPRINREIEKLDFHLVDVLIDTSDMIARDSILESRLESFFRAREKLYGKWMSVLNGYTVNIRALAPIEKKYRNLLAEVLKFNSSI